jgi:hypothetical protein
LLVVIAVLVIVVLVGIPAFASMLAGSERTLAENQLRVGIGAARDASVRGDNVDTAAVFFFTPGGRTSIVTCVWVGRLTDMDANNQAIERDVFAPLGIVEPVQIPKGWSVRGYATPNVLHTPTNQNGWYEQNPGLRYIDSVDGSWVFPETEFYDKDQDQDAGARQTFMVRFEGGTGRVRYNNPSPVVVLSPRASAVGANTRPPGRNVAWRRPDRAPELAVWARRTLARPNGYGAPVMTDQMRRQMIGDQSGDTVLSAAISVVALYNENRMAASVGGKGVNKDTGTIYRMFNGANAPSPTAALDLELFGGATPQQVQEDIDQWLVGTLERNGTPVESDALLFGVDRSSGQPKEIKP